MEASEDRPPDSDIHRIAVAAGFAHDETLLRTWDLNFVISV